MKIRPKQDEQGLRTNGWGDSGKNLGFGIVIVLFALASIGFVTFYITMAMVGGA